MKRILTSLAVIGLLTFGAAVRTANAATILIFGENGSSEISATTNGSGTTTISGTNIVVTISNFFAGGTPITAFFNLSATSTSVATTLGNSHISQDFTGTFSFTSGAGGTGTNYLSGVWSDSFDGLGDSGGLQASTAAGDTVNFTSDFALAFGVIRGLSLSFISVTPNVGIVNEGTNTLAPFSASISGNFSAGTIDRGVPEPASMVLLGGGLLGLAARYRSRRRK